MAKQSLPEVRMSLSFASGAVQKTQGRSFGDVIYSILHGAQILFIA